MLIAGNWKMNTTRDEAAKLAAEVADVASVAAGSEVRIAVCPPFVNIDAVAAAVSRSGVQVGGQNLNESDFGAFTGEVSAPMLRASGCSLVILGHSERRQYYGEDDDLVNRKCLAAKRASLQPIVCVGETLDQRENGREEEVVGIQIEGALKGILPHADWRPVIAYEPVWAIGTGKTATPDQAQAMHAFIRSRLSDLWGGDEAGRTEILYGGSMKPNNARDLLSQSDIDGGLIGGASLVADDFAAIIKTAVEVSS